MQLSSLRHLGLWHEVLAPTELARLSCHPVLRGRSVPRGHGEPVIVVPGMALPDLALRPMFQWLRRIGYTPVPAGLGINVDCGEAGTRRLEALAEQVVAGHAERVAIIGHSRGGSYARALALRRPDLVSGILTLSTPMMSTLDGSHPTIRAFIRGVSKVGSLGVPGVFGSECVDGRCCTDFRADTRASFPANVGFRRIVGANDRIVPQSWLEDPEAETVQVPASHSGIIVNPHAFRAIADGLRDATASAVA